MATLTEEEREYLLTTLRMNEDMANSISQELWEIAVNTARQALAAQVEEEEELSTFPEDYLERIQDPYH
ncbi:hypothetical protein HK096_009325 [Nowakowskiella sp. JEL0078]|nr:hypothetical protein HK096_009325 [Nowakowskiella sp. JEL0078]